MNLCQREFYNLKVKSVEFDLDNSFSFKINNKYQLNDLKINSLLNLKNSKLMSSQNLKEFFPKINRIIELSNHQIQIEYKKIKASIYEALGYWEEKTYAFLKTSIFKNV